MGVEIYVYSEPWTHYIPGGYQYGFGEEYRTFQWQFLSSPKTRKQNFVYICLSKQTFHKDYRQNIAWCFIAKIICFKWECFLELQVFPKWHKIGQMIKRLRIFFFHIRRQKSFFLCGSEISGRNLIGLKLERKSFPLSEFSVTFPTLFSARILRKYDSLQENSNEKESASHLKLWDKRFLRRTHSANM